MRVIGIVLVSSSGLVVFTYPFLSRCKMLSTFRENNNVVAFPFPFHVFMRWPIYSSSVFKDSFPSQGQEVSLTSTSSFPLREGRWHFVEESLSQDLFGPLLRWPSRTLPTLYREEV